MDSPILIPIARITDENPFVKTFWFEYDLKSEPGQFIMLWIPGIDQKPFSIAYDYGNTFGIAVFPVGVFSKHLCTLHVGDRVGVTGPYGTLFTIYKKTHYITVGGGYGAGPLGIFAERMAEQHCTVDFCIGAKNSNLLLFEERIARLPYASIHIATDDGSRGHHGYVTDILNDLLQQHRDRSPENPIAVAACGPELMEKKVLDICNTYGINCEISIERYMKCGFGICGQCTVDDMGIPMCTKGPVVDRETANRISEFGIFHRNKSGAKKSFLSPRI